MREARIILPIVSLDHEHTTIHKGLRRLLCTAFGGCIMTQGSGAWVDGEGNTISETVTIYDVAMEDLPAKRLMLIHLAHNAAQELGQQAVYIRLPNGAVRIDKVGQPELDLSQLDPHGDHFPPYKRELTPAELAGAIQPPEHEMDPVLSAQRALGI